jgi:hypothetical protein
MFEKALARQLRDNRARESACLDPETLAAYYEQLLSAEEMAAAKAHLVGCTRCQEVLAQLEFAETVHELDDDGKASAVAAAGPRTSGGETAPPSTPRKAVTEVAPGKVRELRARTSALRWVAPAGAIAAALLLFIGFRASRSSSNLKEATTQIAENRDEAVRHSEAVPAAPPAVQKQKADAPPSEEYLRPGNPPTATLRQDERRQSRPSQVGILPRSKSRDMADRNAPLAGPEIAKKQMQGNVPASNAAPSKISGKTEAADKNSETALDSMKLRVEVQDKESKSQFGVGGASASPPPPPATLEAAKSAQAAGGVTLGLRTESLSKDQKERAAYSKAAFNFSALPYSIVAPGGKSIWRFGEGGAIAHSINSGSNWESQVAGVTVALTMGSAPSEKVCWLAGEAGTLLRTTDAGKHWQLLTTPIVGDLGGVHASDAQHASIWDVPNRLSFSTSDGGVTWKPTANQ